MKLKDLKDTATQDDINMLFDKIVAQNTEIKQVREELNKCQKDINKLRSQFDGAVAKKLDRKLKSTDLDIGQRPAWNANMAAQNPNTPRRTTMTKLFQGVQGEDDDEMIAHIVRITFSLSVIMYKTDVEYIERLRKHD